MNLVQRIEAYLKDRRIPADVGTWEGIYQKYRETGEKWYIGGELHPHFLALLEGTVFPRKRALDIGCGRGDYLRYLHEKGFSVVGIDNSHTAIELARETAPEASVEDVDMFSYRIPEGEYDLVYSISAIHHGPKTQVEQLVRHIRDTLAPGGSVLLVFPQIAALKTWPTFKEHKRVGKYEYIPLSGPEKGLVHSFYSESEARKLMDGFEDVHIAPDGKGNWVASGGV